MMRGQALQGFRRDSEALKGRRIERALVRRVLHMARPYRPLLIGFAVAVVAAAVVGALPPLLFKELLDTLKQDDLGSNDRDTVALLAIGAVAVAVTNAALSLGQRWYSARIGEGLIYDMRVAL